MKFLLTVVAIFLTIHGFSQNENQHANMKRSAQWPKNSDGKTIIEVTFENPEGFQREINIIKNTINETWAKYGNIEFVNWGKAYSNQKGIRILIYNRKDLSDEANPRTIGLGTEINGLYGGMVLNLVWPGAPSNDDGIRIVAVHEFGHALGFAHEQKRNDIRCDCESSRREDIRGGQDGGWYIMPCDYNSVMNYCNTRWNNYGQLSENDIIGIQTVYGKNPKLFPIEEREQVVNIIDNLGNGQTWENLFIVLGNEQHMLHVDMKNNNDISKFYNKTGNTYYKIWTTTLYSNGTQISGFGEGYIYIQPNSTSVFEVFIQDDITMPNFGRLTLRNK